MIAADGQGQGLRRRYAHPYHEALLRRLDRVNAIRRRAFAAEDIGLWKRAVDAASRIERAIETNMYR